MNVISLRFLSDMYQREKKCFGNRQKAWLCVDLSNPTYLRRQSVINLISNFDSATYYKPFCSFFLQLERDHNDRDVGGV